MSACDKLSTETLHQILKLADVTIEVEEPKKGDLVKAIEKEIDERGISLIVSSLTKDELKKLCDHLKVDLKDAGANPLKPVLSKRLTAKALDLGVDKFVSSTSDNDELLTAMSDACRIDEELEAKKQVKEIQNEIYNAGVESLFGLFNAQFLREVVEEKGLKVDAPTKNKLLKAIVSGKSVKADKSDPKAKALKQAQKEAEAASAKEKPELKKGVNYQDVFQHFGREELYEWCKENGLKVSGNKKDLIKRILAYFDGDKENTMAVPKEKKEKKEGEKKEKTEKSPKSPRKTAKKDEKKEEKKEEEKKEKKGTKN